MKMPVVGKRYKVRTARKGDFVGRCVSGKGVIWEFKVENYVYGLNRSWDIGDVMVVHAWLVESLEEIPLDAQG